MKLNIEAALVYDIPVAADILLAIEVAQMADQTLHHDLLTVDGVGQLNAISGEDGIGRRTWMRAEGRVNAHYQATVDVERLLPILDGLQPTPRAELGQQIVPYLWPSRYCESDRLVAYVCRTFDGLEGGAKIAAMADWIRSHLLYIPGTSDNATTAVDVFVSRQGVCRDFAHLMAAFARAADIPARLVSVYAFGLEPPDFHAVVEVWLEGAWHLVDATGLALPNALARISVGRDATDISFMTIFGTAELVEQAVSVDRLD